MNHVASDERADPMGWLTSYFEQNIVKRQIHNMQSAKQWQSSNVNEFAWMSHVVIGWLREWRVAESKIQNDPYVWCVVDKLNSDISDMDVERLWNCGVDHFPHPARLEMKMRCTVGACRELPWAFTTHAAIPGIRFSPTQSFLSATKEKRHVLLYLRNTWSPRYISSLMLLFGGNFGTLCSKFMSYHCSFSFYWSEHKNSIKLTTLTWTIYLNYCCLCFAVKWQHFQCNSATLLTLY